jgi:hypothetical protein
LRRAKVTITTGIRNKIPPAATTPHSIPPDPSAAGMLTGAVRARSWVNISEKMYSFQAKTRQKTVVAAMPVADWGKTILKNACSRE